VKPQDVKDFYGSQYNFRKMTGMSVSTLGNWLKWGFVPEDAQYKLERITNGKLKTEWTKTDE
jgi:DNA-binding transcriptional regulator Cro